MIAQRRVLAVACTLIAVLALAACGGSSSPAPTVEPPTEVPPTATVVPTATPIPRFDILPKRLQVPSVNIDTAVQLSKTVPDTSTAPAGCPARPPGEDTLTVPTSGVATPEEAIEGLENKAWIFGHSRWLNVPGIFQSLQDMNLGDEVFIDGTNRATGENVTHARYVVDSIFVSDTDDADGLIIANTPADIPAKPQVILQTSAREDGAGKQWLLNQPKVLAKAENKVGDLNDPCKYLLLFVVARAAA